MVEKSRRIIQKKRQKLCLMHMYYSTRVLVEFVFIGNTYLTTHYGAWVKLLNLNKEFVICINLYYYLDLCIINFCQPDKFMQHFKEFLHFIFIGIFSGVFFLSLTRLSTSFFHLDSIQRDNFPFFLRGKKWFSKTVRHQWLLDSKKVL